MHHFGRDGFAVVRQVFTLHECADLREHYMQLRKLPRPGDYKGINSDEEDPWYRFPRMIHMHRWDEVSLRWALDPRIAKLLTMLAGIEPYLVQTMLYFKPPGARGQALHQDNYYLQAQPGTCLAAWLALDDADETNGCMQLIPGTGETPLLCTTAADTRESFTDVTVPVPRHLKPQSVEMKVGDLLIFNGACIHGSKPNRTMDRFRRALIAHYVTGDTKQVNEFYHPVYRMDGSIIELGKTEDGGKCGEWVEIDGRAEVALSSGRHQRLTAKQLLQQ